MLDVLDPDIIVIGEASCDDLNYYCNYNTITQNSAGYITFINDGKEIHIYVSNKNYNVSFLKNKNRTKYNYYLVTLEINLNYKMLIFYMVLGLIVVLIIGLVKMLRDRRRVIDEHKFICEYRDKFIGFVNKYFKNYDRITGTRGSFDGELYIWLTKNVNKAQALLGHTGTMEYIAAFKQYRISSYQIVINTLPKFRDGSVERSDVNSTDDCLLRYLGQLDERIKESDKKLKNLVNWFKIGIQELVSIPLLVLNWFGIFSNRTVNRIVGGTLYQIITGIIALVTLISGLVTIIAGQEQMMEFVRNMIGE